MSYCAAKSQTAEMVRRSKQAILKAALAQTNFGPFLAGMMTIMAGKDCFGPSASIAILLCGGGAGLPCLFRKFSRAEKAQLEAGKHPAAPRNTVFRAAIYTSKARGGEIVLRLPKPAADPKAVNDLLATAAMAVSGRLLGEKRDAELNFEKDLAGAVKHVEELYLECPGISMAEISRAVLDEARRMTGSELGFAACLNEVTGVLEVQSFSGGSWPQAGQRPAVLGSQGLPGRVMRRRAPVLENRVDAGQLGPMPAGHMKIERFLGVPALSGRRLLGMIGVANAQRKYGDADLETMQKLARVYAMILQRKLAEDSQRKEDERFRSIISSSKDIIYTSDLSGRVTYISPRVEDYGYSQEEMIGRHITDFAHPDDKDFIEKAYTIAVKSGRTLPIVPYRVKRKDGSYFYAEQKSSVVEAGGRPAFVTGVMRDVDDQKRTEMRLKESESLMRMVFETAKDCIFIKDMNGMYVKVNGTCAAWMSTKPGDMIGHSDSDYFPPETAKHIFTTDREVVRGGQTVSLNNHYQFPSGDKHINIIKTPLKSLDGRVIGILGIARDISDIKRMETELALTRAAEAVSQVARPMAHDFNNALAAINGYATLIDDGLKDDSPIKNEIAQIIKAVQRAAELTSRFQDFARNPKIGGGEKS